MVCCLIVLIVLSGLTAVSASPPFPLTADEREEEFEFLYTLVAENYPFLSVKERVSGRSWLDRREEFRRLLLKSESAQEHFLAVSQVVGALGNAHTHVVSPEGAQAQPVSPAFETRYQSGSYWISWVHPELRHRLPLLSEVVAVGGVPVDTYVLEHNRPGQLLWDWQRSQAYAWAVPYPATENIDLSLRVAGQERDVTVPRVLSQVDEREHPNLETAVLVPNAAAYLRVRSFSQDHYETDVAEIDAFLREISEYQYLVIDIRGNPGGTTAYWRRLLVEPLIDRSVYVTHYVAARDGALARRYLRERLNAGYYMLQIGRQADERWSRQAPELLTEAYGEPVLFPMIAHPRGHGSFEGQVILLVDDQVYSAAEAMAAFAKASGWALLVGTQTGGDGIGMDPVNVSLPHSGLVVRMSVLLGLDSEGWANEERPTQPDIRVDYAVEDLAVLDYVDGTQPWDAMLRAVVDLIEQDAVPTPRRVGPSFLEWLSEVGTQYMLLDAYGLPRWLPPDEPLPGLGPWQVAHVAVVGHDRTHAAWAEDLATAMLGDVGDWVSLDDIRMLERQLNLYGAHRTVSVALRAASLKDFTAVRAGQAGCGAVEILIHVLEGHPLVLSPPKATARLVDDLLAGEFSVKAANIGGHLVNVGGVWGFGPSVRREASLEFPFVGPSAARLAAEVRRLETDEFAGRRTTLTLQQRRMLSAEWMLQLQQGWVHHIPDSDAAGRSALVGTASFVREAEAANAANGGGWQTRLTAGARYLLDEGLILPLVAGALSYSLPAAEKTWLIARGEVGWSARRTRSEFYWGPGLPVFSSSPTYSRAFATGELELRHRLSEWWSVSGYGQWMASSASESGSWGVGAELRLTAPLGLEAYVRGGRQLYSDESAVMFGLRSGL